MRYLDTAPKDIRLEGKLFFLNPKCHADVDALRYQQQYLHDH